MRDRTLLLLYLVVLLGLLRRQVINKEASSLLEVEPAQGQYIIAARNHFVALRRCPHGWEVNFSNKRHMWKAAVMCWHEHLDKEYQEIAGTCFVNVARIEALFAIVLCEGTTEFEKYSKCVDVCGGTVHEMVRDLNSEENNCEDLPTKVLSTWSVTVRIACSGTTVCHMQADMDNPVLSQIRQRVCKELKWLYFCMEVLCEGDIVQATATWQSLGYPKYVDVVRVPEKWDLGTELLNAIENEEHHQVVRILKHRQGMQVPWAEGNNDPLTYTCAFRHSEEIACSLIAGGATVTTCFDGIPLLHLCIIAGWHEASMALVEARANVLCVDHKGRTCLHQAAWFGRVSCAEWLLDMGLDPLEQSERGDTAFSLARETSACMTVLQDRCWKRLNWMHLLMLLLEDLHSMLVWTDMASLFLTTKCLSKQIVFFEPEMRDGGESCAVEPDFLGGSWSRTPSPASEPGDVDVAELSQPDVWHGNELGGWLITISEPQQFLPVSIAGESMSETFLCASAAAAWFLSVALPGLRGPWASYLCQLPQSVRVEALLQCCFSSVCCWQTRPRVYLHAVLAALGVSSEVHEFLQDRGALYQYVWPKACLKEALMRLGYDVLAPYQELQSVAAVNKAGYDSRGCIAIPWPANAVQFGGNYLVDFAHVFSVLKVVGRDSVWACGKAYVHLTSDTVKDLSCLPGVQVYRVHALEAVATSNASQTGTLQSIDVCGGAASTNSQLLLASLHVVQSSCPIPFAELVQMHQSSRTLATHLGDLQLQWLALKMEVLDQLRRLLNGNVQPPNFRTRVVPAVCWDVYFCGNLQRMFFPPRPVDIDCGCNFVTTWNPTCEWMYDLFRYMEKHAVIEREYNGLFRVTTASTPRWTRCASRCLKLLLGPAVLYISFEEEYEVDDAEVDYRGTQRGKRDKQTKQHCKERRGDRCWK